MSDVNELAEQLDDILSELNEALEAEETSVEPVAEPVAEVIVPTVSEPVAEVIVPTVSEPVVPEKSVVEIVVKSTEEEPVTIPEELAELVTVENGKVYANSVPSSVDLRREQLHQQYSRFRR